MFLIGNVVLDPWSDHVFHIRRVISSAVLPPYLDADAATGASIAEIVSAFPAAGGLCVIVGVLPFPITFAQRSRDRYTASAKLVPKKHRPIVRTLSACTVLVLILTEVGWLVGWLNILGQVAGMSSTEYGLSEMIWAAVVVAKDGNYEITSGKIVGLFVVLLIIHGILVRTVRALQLVKHSLTCLPVHHLFLRRVEFPCDASSRDFNEGIRIRQPWYIRPCVTATQSGSCSYL